MVINLKKFDAALAKSGINLMELAKKSDLSYQSIRRARKGSALKPKTIWKLSRALGVDPLEIMEEEE